MPGIYSVHDAIIGVQSALGGRGGGLRYLLRDEFTTDRAAGAVNGTTSEPTQTAGLRKTVETDGTITIANGILNLSGQTSVTYGDLGLYYSLPVGRVADRAVEFKVRRNGNGVCLGIGLMVDTALASSSLVHCFQLNDAGVNLRTDPNQNGVYNSSVGEWLTLKIVLKATGCDYYVNNVLKGSGTAYTASPLYVGISDGGMSVDVEYIKVWGGPDWGNLVITFDDSRANIYPGFEYAAARGVMGTVYCITNDVDVDLVNSLTSTQLLAMDAAGWALGNHTPTHVQLATLTKAQQEAALSEATADLNAMGLTRASRHVAYPNNSYNADTLLAMASTGMLTGRTVDIVAGGNNPATVAPYQIPVSVGTVLTATTVAALQTVVRACIANGKWGFLLFHQLADTPGGAGEWSTANWQAFINWLVAEGVKTRTIIDYYIARGGA